MQALLRLEFNIFLMIAVGCFIRKQQIIGDAGEAAITGLVMSVILPCNVFCSFLTQNMETMKTVLDALSKGDSSEKNLPDSVIAQGNEIGAALPTDAEKLYECSGWTHVSEWIDQLPGLERGKQSFFQFQVREDSPVYDPGFPIIMLSVLASKYDVMQDGVSCNVERSDDGQNHVVLLRK